jgi:hypothetical protein
MGIYEYACPLQHITEHFVPMSMRPDTYPCGYPDCKEESKLILSATPTTFRQNDRKAFKWRKR